VGKYLCFGKGDFARGLPLLAQGDDQQLRRLAERDLGQPQETEDRLQLADAWWDLAEQSKDPGKDFMLQRAQTWYGLALPNLTGDRKKRVQGRMNQIVQAGLVPVISPERFLATLTGQTWTIHWDNNRQWSKLRFGANRQWGYNDAVVGPWSMEDGAVIAVFARNPQQRLEFRLQSGQLVVAYHIDGTLRHRGVVKPQSPDEDNS
jgi:hypothetical protein